MKTAVRRPSVIPQFYTSRKTPSAAFWGHPEAACSGQAEPDSQDISTRRTSDAATIQFVRLDLYILPVCGSSQHDSTACRHGRSSGNSGYLRRSARRALFGARDTTSLMQAFDQSMGEGGYS